MGLPARDNPGTAGKRSHTIPETPPTVSQAANCRVWLGHLTMRVGHPVETIAYLLEPPEVRTAPANPGIAFLPCDRLFGTFQHGEPTWIELAGVEQYFFDFCVTVSRMPFGQFVIQCSATVSRHWFAIVPVSEPSDHGVTR